MRLIDADRLLSERMKSTYYHLPNGDVAIPLIDIEHAPTIEERKTGKWIEEVKKWLDPDIDNELALERIRAIVYEMENET